MTVSYSLALDCSQKREQHDAELREKVRAATPSTDQVVVDG
jgi:hypothetical protein